MSRRGLSLGSIWRNWIRREVNYIAAIAAATQFNWLKTFQANRDRDAVSLPARRRELRI